MDYLPVHTHKTYIISYYLSISNNILSDTYHTFHDILIALLLSLIRRRTDVHHVISVLNHSHILFVMRRNTRQRAYRHVACQTRNSYTMGCPPVRGDNPRALASGLSYVQMDKHGIAILNHPYHCRPCTSRDISCLSW